MAIAKLTPIPKFDLARKLVPWQTRRVEGKALRELVPHESHAEWSPGSTRPDPLKLLARSNEGRQLPLVPLRMGRMAASPFAFLRGSACVMASDLSTTPITGISVVMDGDAHLNNFGFYGTAQHEIVFDLNDFDEAVIGPWEWDLKRLVASVNVAGRQNGLSRSERATAVRRSVAGYRFNAERLQDMGVLDTWYLHAYPGRQNSIVKPDAKSRAVIEKVVKKALQTDNRNLLPKVAEKNSSGEWTFKDDPPILIRVNAATRKKVIQALNQYSTTVSRERRVMLSRYHIADVAHRVVGVGSVGTRAYLALLFGNGDEDPLFLQVKESVAAAHSPYLPPVDAEFRHNGKRVMVGQRTLQASSDPMLGYTSIDGRDYYVRQMKNLKASIPVEWLTGSAFNFYSWACGSLLARAHARVGDCARIAGYCGNYKSLDEALATWAEHYGDQVERDHGALVDAIRTGKVKARVEGDDGG